MGTTGDPNRLSPADAPRAGGVLAQARGAQGRSGRATGRLPGSAGFVPRAVPVTVPAGGVADGRRRRRGAVVLDSVAALHRPRKRPQLRTTPCRTCSDCWWPARAAPASPSPGRQQAAPWRGRGCLLHRHPARGTAARRLGRDPGSAQAARQREAIVLTSCLDLSPDLAAAAMRVSLATLRRRLAEARSALRAALPSNL